MNVYEIAAYEKLKRLARTPGNQGCVHALKELHKRIFAYDLSICMIRSRAGVFPHEYTQGICDALVASYGEPANRICSLLVCFFDRCDEYRNGEFSEEQQSIIRHIKKCRKTMSYGSALNKLGNASRICDDGIREAKEIKDVLKEDYAPIRIAAFIVRICALMSFLKRPPRYISVEDHETLAHIPSIQMLYERKGEKVRCIVKSSKSSIKALGTEASLYFALKKIDRYIRMLSKIKV